MDNLEEKTKAVRDLQWSFFKKEFKATLFLLPLLLSMNVIIAFANNAWVQNPWFSFFGALINCFFVFRLKAQYLANERDRVNQEIKKILSQ